jgi:hypothetical protein
MFMIMESRRLHTLSSIRSRSRMPGAPSIRELFCWPFIFSGGWWLILGELGGEEWCNTQAKITHKSLAADLWEGGPLLMLVKRKGDACFDFRVRASGWKQIWRHC